MINSIENAIHRYLSKEDTIHFPVCWFMLKLHNANNLTWDDKYNMAFQLYDKPSPMGSKLTWDDKYNLAYQLYEKSSHGR